MIGRFFKTAADSAGQAGGARRMRQAVKVAVLLTVLGVAGFLVAASGIIPIKASSGHWAITSWFLQFAKERSVATHTLTLKSPSLEEPWLVLKGAGHYEIGCRPCHGSPDLQHPRIAQRMLPVPPYLPQTINRWNREELFYMVKHGIKFTGMPAWPSQERDDEVWAMVAFLLAFPELDAEEYRRLVNGEAVASKQIVPLAGLLGKETAPGAVITSCGRCHGVDGLGRESAAFPKLAGQRPLYLAASLEGFARGGRHSGIMEPIAAGLSSEQMRELSRYYGSLKAPLPSPLPQQVAPAIERGEAIAQRGIPNQRVPACADCHGPSDTPRNPIYPVLAGQHADYLALQLTLFKQEQRGGTAYAHLMRHVAAGLSAEQMHDVAHYYAALSPAPALPARHESKAAP
jgi:cytochrome c553